MPLKSREVKPVIKSMGFERGVVHVLETLAEEQNDLHKVLRGIASDLSKVIGLFNQTVDIQGELRTRLIRLEEPRHPELGTSTQSPMDRT